MTVQMHIHLMARFHWVHFTNLRKQLVDCSPLVLGRRPSNREVTQCIIRKILIIWMLWECRVLCFIDEKIVLIPAWMIRAEFTTTSRRCCFRSFVDERSINQWVYNARFFGYAKKIEVSDFGHVRDSLIDVDDHICSHVRFLSPQLYLVRWSTR